MLDSSLLEDLEVARFQAILIHSGGHIVDKIENKAGFDVSRWNDWIPTQRITWLANTASANVSSQNFIISISSEGKVPLIIGQWVHRDGGLWALRATFEVLGSVSGEVVDVVDAVDESLVALLETHDKFRGNFKRTATSQQADTKGVVSLSLVRWGVVPELGNIELETEGELGDVNVRLKVDQSWEVEDGREEERLGEDDVEGQMVDIRIGILVITHFLSPRPTSWETTLVTDSEVIVVVLIDDVLGSSLPKFGDSILVVQLE